MTGEVKEVSLYKCVADYVVANNDKFELVPNNVFNNIKDSFCFAVRKDDTPVKVGVTGDLPPLDLILPDNSPAGFNTALLADVDKPEAVEFSSPYFEDSIAHVKLKADK